MSLFNKPGLSITVASAATITANKFVTLAGALPAAPSDAIGVVLNAAVSGDSMTVHVEGIVPVTAGAGGVTAGSLVEVLAAGTVQDISTGTVVGRALTAAASGELASILLLPVKRQAPGIVAAGTATLVAGTVTVTNAAVLSTDKIFVTRMTTGGTVGHLRVGTITDNTSFVLEASVNTDTSTVAWLIVR